MALVTTTFEVLAVLAAMAALLWFSAFVEARQLGPVATADHPYAGDAGAGVPVLAPAREAKETDMAAPGAPVVGAAAAAGVAQLAEVGQAA